MKTAKNKGMRLDLADLIDLNEILVYCKCRCGANPRTNRSKNCSSKTAFLNHETITLAIRCNDLTVL